MTGGMQCAAQCSIDPRDLCPDADPSVVLLLSASASSKRYCAVIVPQLAEVVDEPVSKRHQAYAVHPFCRLTVADQDQGPVVEHRARM
jgi:hypothetical protein